MNTQLCQHGCGLPATYTTKSSLINGPFKGKPVHQCAKSHNSCPAVKAKKIQASIEKYGTKYPWQSKEIANKRDATNIEKYGSKCSLKNTAQAEKRKATMLERYGVEEPTQNAEIRAKASTAMKQAFIDDPSIADRIIKTRKARFGNDLAPIMQKIKTTQVANGRWVDPAKKTDWVKYKREVMRLTHRTYKQHRDKINPMDLPRGTTQYQVDHIYSIRHGFENKVEPAMISHYANLRMLWHADNQSKHVSCDMTLEELTERVKSS